MNANPPFSPSEQPHILSSRNLVMRREILERPRVVRHQEERGIRVAEGEVGGGKK